MAIDIIPAGLAIKAMMDTGYKNAAYALAELMDNSIQAKATNVELLCLEKLTLVDRRERVKIQQIGVLDDGEGMNEATLSRALQFGNGNRLNDEDPNGMGKFGMGLPSASISQAKRVEVWTWTNGIDSAIYTYLDVNEVIKNEMKSIPEPSQKKIPDEWQLIGKSFGKSGTLVLWSGLDKCIWKTGKAIIQNSEFLIGRVYRKFLDADIVTIRMATFDGDAKDRKCTFEAFAKANDPLYLMSNSSTPSPFDKIPMFEPWPSPENHIIKIPIKYGETEYKVTMKSSMAKKEARSDGAGNRGYGSHALKNIGLSILRAGREIELDRSWAKFGEPRERWWGLEIDFPPGLDELFGVTNNKQSARNFSEMAKLDIDEFLETEGKSYQEMKADLSEEDDPKLPLIELTQAIRRQISQMSEIIKVQKLNTRAQDKRTRFGSDPEKEATERTRERQEQGKVGFSDAGEIKSIEERTKEITEELTNQGLAPIDAKNFADKAIEDSLKYIFTEAGLDSPAFFSVQPKGGALMITLNTNHSAYARLLDVLESDEDGDKDDLRDRLNNALAGLKLLLMAWARYEDEQQPEARERAQDARIDWGRIARKFMDKEI